MTDVLVCYGTTEGQTATVADRIADVLRGAGHDVDVADLPIDAAPADYDGVLVGASVHAGKHQRPVTEFVADHRDELNAMPSGFFSVSLSAASESPDGREEAQAVVDDFLDETGWSPDVATTVAGALRYSQYGRIKRLLMRFIAGRHSGDTDTSRDYEYTDWDDVEAFAHEFERTLVRPGGPSV
ncbi:flavodoxin domain-containing protein [Halomicrococcus gelatinilyticus]|uniref:flavodoxin domain-containing protein n=1 Tax=Halomicrococcus gelatinilyticus TaxID=1702103 RepID=UPI002E1682AD